MLLAELEDLIRGINRTNAATMPDEQMTVTDAIARRDVSRSGGAPRGQGRRGRCPGRAGACHRAGSAVRPVGPPGVSRPVTPLMVAAPCGCGPAARRCRGSPGRDAAGPRHFWWRASTARTSGNCDASIRAKGHRRRACQAPRRSPGPGPAARRADVPGNGTDPRRRVPTGLSRPARASGLGSWAGPATGSGHDCHCALAGSYLGSGDRAIVTTVTTGPRWSRRWAAQ